MSQMDDFEWLEKVQKLVNFLLRYVVAGGSAVLAFGITQSQMFSFLRLGNELSVLLLMVFVFVVGPAIYAIHRSFLHWLPLSFMFLFLRGKYPTLNTDNREIKKRQIFTLDRALTKQLEIWRKAPVHDWLSTYEPWAAQIHFLYCSVWGIGLAVGFAWLFNNGSRNKLPLVIAALILLISALVSDWRLTSLQIQRTIEDGGLTTSVNSSTM